MNVSPVRQAQSDTIIIIKQSAAAEMVIWL
jgi:hypothetical protein